MSTRSTIRFYSEFSQDKPVMSVYRQFDGYISGVGHELAKWLKGKKVINGFHRETMEEGFANGMGCLAAQYVARHKDCIGYLYLTDGSDTQEYNYEVRLVDGQFEIRVGEFSGTPDELLVYNENEE